jgi:phosphoribosylaminoimidazolecarboxamide formyltransferase/IMP cyclohydrolase
MADKPLSRIYREIADEDFPESMEIVFRWKEESRKLVYEKVMWEIGGELKGLRYGENPGQPAALYRPVNGNMIIGGCKTIEPGRYLASDIELLQSGKHPGKTNITDIDNALNILRYFSNENCVVIVKHNNPCGVSKGGHLADAYRKAYLADKTAAFGGAVACSKPVDRETAELMAGSYIEVVAAPDYEEGTVDILSGRKNLRIIKIERMAQLGRFIGEIFVDMKSLIDGSVIVQQSFVPVTLKKEDMLPASAQKDGETVSVNRAPTESEYDDLLFGWLVETGITSNSVIYVKDGTTVGIGTGEQDRVGVAEIARDKAYKKCAERYASELYRKNLEELSGAELETVNEKVRETKGGLTSSVMVSDAFFPFRDGVDVGLREGVTAVVQPGGALRDFESIEACNEYGASMVFTGQRCFKH